jgi:hypothetical protein
MRNHVNREGAKDAKEEENHRFASLRDLLRALRAFAVQTVSQKGEI